MKNRKKTKRSLLLMVVLLCLVASCLWRGWSVWTLRELRTSFVAQVSPVQEKMRTFTELSLSFLSGDVETFPRHILAEPEIYLRSLKYSFRAAVEIYNSTAETPLLIEKHTQEFVDTLSLEQKVAQLFILGFEGTELDKDFSVFLETQQPGGVILMGRNVSEATSGVIAQIQNLADSLPFFVATDQEGGQVARIPETLPTQAELSREEVCPTYLARSELLRGVGVNMNFGIIADVTDDTSSFIYPRVFHGEVDKKITDAVQCTTETLSTLKHFPGHGVTASDSHAGIIIANRARELREKNDLPPFVAGIQAGVDAIMSAHILLPWLDEKFPVSLSASGVALLREQGFLGLIITDDLGMLRSDYSEKDAIKQALLAGNDLLLLVNPSDPGTLLTYAADLVREGVISQQDIDSRLARIVHAKNKIIKLGRYVPLELVR